MKNNAIEKIGAFFGLFAAVVGCVGAIGYLCQTHAYVIAAGVVVLAAFAAPTVKKLWDILNS